MRQSTPERVERLGVELVTTAGRLVRTLARSASIGVPAATMRLLAQIDELAPVTVGALATADRCSQPTMSTAVHALAERGWATKRPNPADARSSLVELTDDGALVLAELRAGTARLVAERLECDPDLREEDLATAVSVLQALLATPRTLEGQQL